MKKWHIFQTDRAPLVSAISLAACVFLFFSGAIDCFALGKPESKSKESEPPVEQAEPESAQREPTQVDKLGALIAAGKTEEAKALFISEIKPNDLDWDGRNAVHHAALARNSDLADFFIRLGTKADTKDNENNTPLNISANSVDDKTAAVLAASGADIHNVPRAGESPAKIAIYPGNSAFLNSILTGATLISTDANGDNILHFAADADNLSAVDAIIRNARDLRGNWLQEMINKKNAGGKTPLDITFSHKSSRQAANVSASIISAGGTSSDPMFAYFAPAVRSLNYNLRASNGVSSLHFAVHDQYTGWTDFLLEKNADPNIKSTSGDTPLIEAARIGSIPIMQKLISRGALVNSQDAQGNTAMHIAIPPTSHREALSLILANGGNPNIQNARGDSPAHVVIDLDRPVDVLEALLSRGADVSIHNNEGKTPLFTAVEKNRTALIPLLLRYKSDIFAATNQGVTPFERALQQNNNTLDELITEETVQQSDTGGNTPLIAAVRLNANTDVVRRILDKNANINARNQEGDTALHLAVRQNEAASGELLISRGADIFLQNAKLESPLYLTFPVRGGVREWMFVPAVLSARDGQGKTILHWTAEWKLDQVIPLIVSRGAAIEAKNSLGETPLFVAVRINSASTVRAFLQSGASLNERDTLGNTALHTAVNHNSQAAAETLISSGTNLNAYNFNSHTPLHEAVRYGKYAFVNLLIQSKANLEARDAAGNTPLMMAVTIGNRTIVELIIRANADVNTRNNDGSTPLLVAVINERSDLVALLLDNRAQIHAKNADGESPYTAALKISPRIALSLLEKGRDQTDEEGRSPLHIALLISNNENEIEEIINWSGARQLSVFDRQGRIPLRYAVDLGNWAAAKYLTDQGSNVFSVARDGKTPAEIVLETGNRDAIRALFGGKAISATDQQGNTVLHFAAKLGSVDAISFLLELGASRTTKNTTGDTPADIAERWGNTGAASLLRSF